VSEYHAVVGQLAKLFKLTDWLRTKLISEYIYVYRLLSAGLVETVLYLFTAVTWLLHKLNVNAIFDLNC